MISIPHLEQEVEGVVPRIKEAINGVPFDDAVSSLLAVAIDVTVDGSLHNVQWARSMLHKSIDEIIVRYVNTVIHEKQG